jgi:hypothetical protein
MFLRIIGGFFACAMAVVPMRGQEPVAPPTAACDVNAGVPSELSQFLTGDWAGAGQFASGKPIEADVTFMPDLDSHWLVYRHVDRAPGRYKVLGMWGCERSRKQFVMVLNDNGGGLRMFVSDGWAHGGVVFHRSTAVATSPYPKGEERFTFVRQSDDTFKMTYDTTVDGTTWNVGDWLLFKRKG